VLSAIGAFGQRVANATNPWTNVYGLARTILALATAATLAVNGKEILFHPLPGVATIPPLCTTSLQRLGVYCLSSGHLDHARWFSVAALLLVASGYRPRFTGLLHWWVAFSLPANAVLIDGGDQVSMILAMLLIPVTLTDSRKWHWDAPIERDHTTAEQVRRLVALVAFFLVRAQVAGIYFHSSVGKFPVEEWADGTALYYWILHPMFGATPWIARLIRPLLLNGTIVATLSWVVTGGEYFLSAALVMPKKYWRFMLAYGLLLHTGIIFLFGLVSFGTTMFAALILFLRPVSLPFARCRRVGH
jgi:antimicrobial peptide system SdpB family protein